MRVFAAAFATRSAWIGSRRPALWTVVNERNTLGMIWRPIIYERPRRGILWWPYAYFGLQKILRRK